MNKYSGRSFPTFSRSDDDQSSSLYEDWLSNLQKNSNSSVQDQLSSILGLTKNKYSNVEEAVQDMKERTGLRALLESRASAEPKIFTQMPQMKIFIDNFVQDRPGTSIESVVHELLKSDGIRDQLSNHADIDDDVRTYINQAIGKANAMNVDHHKVDLNMGKVDTHSPAASDDPLAICEPATSQS